MIEKGDKIIVAVSGGPDSMCLLHMLKELEKVYEMEVYAAHVNHCLRGMEAEKDEEYVRSFCEEYKIPFYYKRVDISTYAKERGISCEMAGREARYGFFSELMKKTSAQKIALAHNANDQAETILMRMMRGTGIDGLRGIRAVRDKVYIRPVLVLSRDEIETYCSRNNLKPRIDKTNLESIYSRNKIRLELIPYIQSNFNSDIITVLNRFAHSVDRDGEFIDNYAEEKFNVLCHVSDDKIILESKVFDEKEAIITRIIRKAIDKLLGSVYNFESSHIYDIINLSSLGTGKKISLPNGIEAKNIYGRIQLNKVKYSDDTCEAISEQTLLKKNEQSDYNLRNGIHITLPEFQITVDLRLISKNTNVNFKENALTKYFDYDKIINTISVRTRREGDRFVPLGMNGSKKVKDLFIDMKIPKDERGKVPILRFDNEIAWIIGYRESNKFKIQKESNNIIQVKIKERNTK
jgi:tRNA(Ile)-lysidine synthetase, N-terminal domain/tRNA(Ile)-lysidine synthetase, C-terminal domain